MFRAFLSRLTVVRFATAVALALTCQTADAQVKPFKVIGSGDAPIGLSVLGTDSPHDSKGTATHLGKYTGNGTVNVIGPNTFKGSFVFVAANGDKLYCTYGDTSNGAAEAGEFQLFDVGGGKSVLALLAEFNPVPALSTGQFKNVVDGSFFMLAVTEPFVFEIDPLTGFTPPLPYSWAGLGWLEFAKKRK